MEKMQKVDDKFVITIGREYGTGGHNIGKKVAEKLGIPFYDEEIGTMTAIEFDIEEERIKEIGEYPGKNTFTAGADKLFNYQDSDDRIFIMQSEILWKIANKQSCVIVGRCADYVLRNHAGIYSFFLYSGLKKRIEYIKKEKKRYPKLSGNPESDVLKMDRRRAASYHFYTGQTWGEPSNYHMCIDSCILGVQTSDIIVDFVNRGEKLRKERL